LIGSKVSHARAGRHLEAIKYYDEVLKRHDHVDAWVAKGAALASVGSLQPAIDSFHQALKFDPACANAKTYLEATLKKLEEKTHSILIKKLAAPESNTVTMPISKEKLYVRHPPIASGAEKYMFVDSVEERSQARSSESSKKEKKKRKKRKKAAKKKGKKSRKRSRSTSSEMSFVRQAKKSKANEISHPILQRSKHHLWGA